jgi:ectoine hydroxylase-related dioxygenase (phytanoyl-CoA dioxygenase family)
MNRFDVTQSQIDDFHRDGFFVVERLLDAETVDLLARIAHADREVRRDADVRGDGEGGAVQVTVRNELPRDSIYGAIVRSSSIVDTMEKLLGGEVYHYNHKMVLKDARDGGAFAWHQDYGYWYHYCCPFPLLASCMIAVHPARRDNGCLQVINGSHHMGRVDHGKVGDQVGADPRRVKVALDRLELVHCELDPGSAVFFHCNLLHRSDQNRSDHPRWAFICCYNAARNDPFQAVRHPRYTPLEKWPDANVVEIGRLQWAAMQPSTHGSVPAAEIASASCGLGLGGAS